MHREKQLSFLAHLNEIDSICRKADIRRVINNETENSLQLQIDHSRRCVTAKEPQGHCSWDASVNI